MDHCAIGFMMVHRVIGSLLNRFKWKLSIKINSLIYLVYLLCPSCADLNHHRATFVLFAGVCRSYWQIASSDPADNLVGATAFFSSQTLQENCDSLLLAVSLRVTLLIIIPRKTLLRINAPWLKHIDTGEQQNKQRARRGKVSGRWRQPPCS